MIASKVISKIQKLIESHGDIECKVELDNETIFYEAPIYDVLIEDKRFIISGIPLGERPE